MAVKYVKYQNQNESSQAYGKTFLRAVQDDTIDLAGLASHMAEHDTVFSKGTIIGVLTDMARCIRELVLNSKAVKIDDVCILRLGFSCNGAETPEKATVKNITGLNINSMGTGRMAVKTLINEVQFKELKKYNGLDGESDTNESPNDPQGDGKHTLKLKYQDGSEEELFYAEGEAITYPQNTQDYVWPMGKPTVMPDHDVTVTEELDPNLDPGV